MKDCRNHFKSDIARKKCAFPNGNETTVRKERKASEPVRKGYFRKNKRIDVQAVNTNSKPESGCKGGGRENARGIGVGFQSVKNLEEVPPFYK